MRRTLLLLHIPAAILVSASLGYAQDTVSLRAGEFSRVDRSHWASGTATVIQMAETESLSVVFESAFKVAAGPDLRVVLSQNPDPKRGRDLGKYTELGLLTTTEGSQTYEIPAGVSAESIGSVVIYCKKYDVIFSTATLALIESPEEPEGR
ncbi:MAG: DM13 domain-containing protein [Gemmatimonadota bacterium]